MARAVERRTHALVTLHTSTPIRKWTGGFDLTYGGEVYTGVQVTGVGDGGGSGLRGNELRMGVRLGIRPSERPTFLRSVGAPPVTVLIVYSGDGGQTWDLVDTIRGRVGNPLLRGLVYSFTVEPRTPIFDQGRIGLWSHPDRQRRNRNDFGMRMMASLTNAGEVIGWPAAYNPE